MNTQHWTLIVLTLFCLGAVFGLYLPTMSATGHEVGCPFSPGGTVVCGVPLAHLKHWQSAFAVVLAELLIFFALALIFFFARYNLFDPDVGQDSAYRRRQRVPIRPPLYQELFSDGILNRKEPYYF